MKVSVQQDVGVPVKRSPICGVRSTVLVVCMAFLWVISCVFGSLDQFVDMEYLDYFQQLNKPAILCKNLIGSVCGPVTRFMATCRGTLQAVGNVMGSLYLSVLFLGDCLDFPHFSAILYVLLCVCERQRCAAPFLAFCVLKLAPW